MFAEERHEAIMDLIEKKRKVRVSELSSLFEVSEATVRSDLRHLERRGLVKRTHGGAVSPQRARFEPSFIEKESRYRAQKAAIGKAAAGLIENGDTIILDSGTTTMEVASNLEKLRDLTIVVNDPRLAIRLEKYKDIQVICTGGIMRWREGSFVGPIAERTLERLHIDRAFMGANGVDVERGLTAPDVIHAETKRKMAEIAGEVVVVADHTKVGVACFAQVCPPESIDMLVTDDGLSDAEKESFEERNIKVITAEVAQGELERTGADV